MAEARVGFASLSVGPSTQESALRALQRWLEDPRFLPYRAQIVALIEAGRWEGLVDSFCRELPFGTGGRRGRVGIGPNRFNPWTFSTSVQGHAEWLRRTHPDGPLMMVIGYDVRRFMDLSQQLVPSISTPIDGITSRNFAEIAAEIYAAHEITAVLPGADDVLSTPELSFAIRDLQASGGLVISASHNPPDDNGSKFYHDHGGQFVPPFDQDLADIIAQVRRVERMPFDRGIANGLIREMPESVHANYLACNLAAAPSAAISWQPIVFTPLHGTADTSVGEVLRAAGVPVSLEPTQAVQDGSFPTVPFKAPNPESPEALDRAIEEADRLGAAVVMGCDPDADRIGVAVRHLGKWETLSGHDIAALVTHAALSLHTHTEPLVLKTDVTTRLVSRIAEAHGAVVVDDLLVGFKYIGEALFMLERKGRFQGIEGDIDQFAVGVEESHGVLVTHGVRDKDAAGGALLLAWLASQAATLNRTLVDELNDLMRKHGVYANRLGHLVLHGAVGRERIDRIMESLRSAPPATVSTARVVSVVDRLEGTEACSATARAGSNMLCLMLEGDARITIRPSGTEPKLKIYVETCRSAGADLGTDRAHLDEQARQLLEETLLLMMDRIQVVLPAWALHISDRVDLETKIEWSNRLVPALLEQLELAPGNAKEWLKSRLTADERALLRPGIVALNQSLGFDHVALRDCFDGAGSEAS